MEGNRQALIPKSKNNAPKTRRLGHLSFARKTRVRNQYEDGEHVEHVNYNVNATRNAEMPGYPMHSPHFKPHSKSSLQTSITEMERLRKQKMAENTARQFTPWVPRQLNDVELNSLSTGWQPAVSSVGNDKNVSMRNARNNLAMMKNEFGNAWIDAEIRRNELLSAGQQSEKKILNVFNTKLTGLESAFYEKYGINAPTKLKRLYRAHLNETPQSMNANHWLALYEEQMRKIPVDVKDSYNRNVKKITANREQNLNDNFSKAEANFEKIKKGKAYAPYVQRTLANRLRNAKAVSNAELFL